MSPVIQVENLSKKYRLGVINRQMLVDQIESWVARKLGRPDPHAKVFEHATDRMPTPYDFWGLKDMSFEIEKGSSSEWWAQRLREIDTAENPLPHHRPQGGESAPPRPPNLVKFKNLTSTLSAPTPASPKKCPTTRFKSSANFD